MDRGLGAGRTRPGAAGSRRRACTASRRRRPPPPRRSPARRPPPSRRWRWPRRTGPAGRRRSRRCSRRRCRRPRRGSRRRRRSRSRGVGRPAHGAAAAISSSELTRCRSGSSRQPASTLRAAGHASRRVTASPLLDVGDADGLGRHRLADEAGEQEDGEQVGQRLDQLHRHHARPPAAARPAGRACSASVKANSRQASRAGTGRHLPKIRAASAR